MVAVKRDEGSGALTVMVESESTVIGCRAYGVVAHGHGRIDDELVDAPAMGRPVKIVWRKRRWVCPEPSCPIQSFVEQDESIVAKARRWRHGPGWGEVDDHGDVLVAPVGVTPDVLVDADHPYPLESGWLIDQPLAAFGDDRAVRGVPRHPESVRDTTAPHDQVRHADRRPPSRGRQGGKGGVEHVEVFLMVSVRTSILGDLDPPPPTTHLVLSTPSFTTLL